MCSLLGELLRIPVRDIYVDPCNPAPFIARHPWYKGQDDFGIPLSCVIKSHEKPGSHLHNFDHMTIHLIRDGRDVVTSKFYFEKDFCVLNGLHEKFDTPFNVFLAQTVSEWSDYIYSWKNRHIVECNYENLMTDPIRCLQNIGHKLGYYFSPEDVVSALHTHSKENMRASLSFFKGDFVRKGIIGDWKHLFDDTSTYIFKKHAGEILVELGYEHNFDW